jgi:hypothetical protein
MSFDVHEFPSLHVLPSGSFGFEHTPLVGSQMPAEWHWSLAVQTTGLVPVQTPTRQASTWVQALPSLHWVPSLAFDHVVVETAGAQTWQALAGSTVPAAMSVPPMKQSAAHVPVPSQTWPLPQLVPLGSVDHAVVEIPGEQTWQAFAGFTVPDG